VPGEYRAMLRRLIVVQGDTEPASVEQQRHLGKTAPSLYDMRNLFQVNVEEGRHLWAMVYLLQKYFGKDGREEAESLLQRRSGRRRQAAHARRLQRGDAGLALVLHVHRSSPTATARCSWKAWRSRASIRSRAPAASC
jgi:1,2-phenylacetyl-CoA epoxidase catalytic subunit